MADAENIACSEVGKRNIGAFVIYDLETNCLPEHNFNKVSITELCFYGFLSEALPKKPVENDCIATNCNTPKTPRALLKLTLVVNPKSRIDPGAVLITGLDNFMLEDFGSFDKDTALLLVKFVEKLPQPVCLIAHNGDKFDFPILKATMNKLKVEFPENTLCVDSLKAFKILEEQATTTIKEDIDPVKCQELNENTPKRPRLSTVIQTYDNNPTTPTSRSHQNSSARRALFNSNKKSSSPSSNKKSFKLQDIYERRFGELPSNAHFAESDVDSLMKLIFNNGERFLEYAQLNAKLFNDIPFAHIRSTN